MQWGTEVTDALHLSDVRPRASVYVPAAGPGADGSTEQVGSWLAGPGDDVTVTGSTRFTGTDLVRLEITKLRRGAAAQYECPEPL